MKSQALPWLAGLALLSGQFAAAAPANDSFATPQSLGPALPATATGDAAGATLETHEPIPSEAVPPFRSVWYSWTAPANAQVAPAFAWTDTGAGEQGITAVFTVFTGSSLTNLSPLASAPAPLSGRSFQATAGTTYRIQLMLEPLDGVTTAPFSFSLANATAPPAPANDHLANAQTIPGSFTFLGSFSGTTAGATVENGEVANFGDRSVWLKWTPSATGGRSFTIYDPDLIGYPYLEVYTGTATDNLTPIGSGQYYDDIRLNVTAGTTYYLRAWSDYTDESDGGFTIEIDSLSAVGSSNAFASAATLSLGAVSNNTTAGCSTQSGERLPHGMGATRWFKWTATATGWFQVTPDAPEVIPMVAVWRGTTLANLKLIGTAPYMDGSPATFHATTGDPIYFQCGPWGAWTGAFSLLLETAADPGAPRLTNLAVAPATVNVGAADQTVTVSLTVAGPADAVPFSVGLLHPDGGIVAAAGSDEITLASGTPGNGVYQAALTVPQGSKAGAYRIVSQLYDPSTDSVHTFGSTSLPKNGFLMEWWEWDNLLDVPAGTDTLTVSGGSDQAPQLASFTVTPAGGSTAAGDLVLTLDVQATDDSGIDWVYAAGFDAQDGVSSVDAVLELATGTATNGTWRGTLTVPQDTPAHRLAFLLEVGDAKGRLRTFGFLGSGSFPPPGSRLERIPGSHSSVPITNPGPSDRLPPQVREATVTPNPADLSGGPLEVTVTARVIDDASGLAGTEFEALLAGPVQDVPLTLTRMSGTTNDGIYQGNATLPTSLESGSYLLILYVEDAAGRGLLWLPSDMPWLPTLAVSGGGASGFAAWAAGFELAPPDNTPQAIPMADGIDNLLKYAFNLDPTAAIQGPARTLDPLNGTAGLPAFQFTAPAGPLRLTYLRSLTAPDLTYQPEFCSDPGAAGPNGWTPATGTETIDPVDTDWQRVTIADEPPAGATRRFGRVRVILATPP